MKELFLTWAQSRFSFGGRNYSMPSRFLTDLGYNPYDEKEDDFGDDSDFDEIIDDPFPEEEVWESSW